MVKAPQRQVWNGYNLLYPDNSLGWSIAGRQKPCCRFKAKTFFISYADVCRKNTVIVIAGNINEKQAIAKNIFSQNRKGAACMCAGCCPHKKREYIVSSKNQPAHLVIGMPAYSALSAYALDVLSAFSAVIPARSLWYPCATTLDLRMSAQMCIIMNTGSFPRTQASIAQHRSWYYSDHERI